MNTRAEDIDTLMSTVARAIERLPATTITALAKDPRFVSVALATAAGVVGEPIDARDCARHSDDPGADHVDEKEARERLAGRTRAVSIADTLSSDEVAEMLGLKGRVSVLQRLRDHRLIGLEGERRGVRFPRAQFDPEGRLWPGASEVRALFPDAFAAWLWLTTGSATFDGDTPLDRLRTGDAATVVAAARGERQGDFA